MGERAQGQTTETISVISSRMSIVQRDIQKYTNAYNDNIGDFVVACYVPSIHHKEIRHTAADSFPVDIGQPRSPLSGYFLLPRLHSFSSCDITSPNAYSFEMPGVVDHPSDMRVSKCVGTKICHRPYHPSPTRTPRTRNDESVSPSRCHPRPPHRPIQDTLAH
jgi:hypothetical protein